MSDRFDDRSRAAVPAEDDGVTVRVEAGDLEGEERQAVFAALREHNRERARDSWDAREKPENAARPLAVVARDGAGNVVGGVTGTTQLAWWKVEVLAVVAPWRGKGIGRRLLAVAEDEARRRGCRHAYADTMDHQAPRLFEKAGWTEVGRLDDWDSFGRAKHLFVKRLG